MRVTARDGMFGWFWRIFRMWVLACLLACLLLVVVVGKWEDW